MNYYNEFDTKAAAWLRELIRAGLIPPGDVDERSITEVKADELTKYTQCHFFAGIGGWSHALQLAGWPTTRNVWTGSCPCQPFSSAGKQLGAADERHLWPAFFNLIRECRPECVFGEQVASAIGHGWLDGICADLEAENYACGAVVLGAHSLGAPHIRQRLYWVAESTNTRRARGAPRECGHAEQREQVGGLANTKASDWGRTSGEDDGRGWVEKIGGSGYRIGWLGHANNARPQGRDERRNGSDQRAPWAASLAIECRDGKTRRISAEPAFFPLVDGLPAARVGILRGAGNAIVPQVAAEFVKAFIAL